MPPLSSPEPNRTHPRIPIEVKVSFWVWLLSAGIDIVAGILVAVNKPKFVADFVKANANFGLSPAELTQAANSAFIGMLIGIFGFCLLYILFVVKMRAGRNWARVVLAGLAIVSLFFQAVVVGTTDLVAMIGVLISVVGLVFMFVPNANAYFAKTNRRL